MFTVFFSIFNASRNGHTNDIIEGNLKLNDRWKQLDPEKLKVFIVTLLLINPFYYGVKMI